MALVKVPTGELNYQIETVGFKLICKSHSPAYVGIQTLNVHSSIGTKAKRSLLTNENVENAAF